MRVSNVAYAPAQIRLAELVFQGYWPYEHDTIGSMQDLDNAQLDWVRAFHDSHYAPNLAVLTIAGDFDTDEAMQLVHRFFDTAQQAGEGRRRTSRRSLPEQTSPRTAVARRRARQDAGLLLRLGHPARRARPITTRSSSPRRILTDGESSRLHQKLVRDEALAQDVSGWTDDHRGPDLLRHRGEARRRRASSPTSRRLIDAEIDALAKDGPTDAEMTKVRNRTEAAFLFGLQSNLQRANKLGQYELFWGDARLLERRAARTTSPSPKTTSSAWWPSTSRRRAAPSSRSAPPPRGGCGAQAGAPPRPRRPAAPTTAPRQGGRKKPHASKTEHRRTAPRQRNRRRQAQAQASQKEASVKTSTSRPSDPALVVPDLGRSARSALPRSRLRLRSAAQASGGRGRPTPPPPAPQPPLEAGARSRRPSRGRRAKRPSPRSSIDELANGSELDVVTAHTLPIVQIRVRRQERRRRPTATRPASPTSPPTC